MKYHCRACIIPSGRINTELILSGGLPAGRLITSSLSRDNFNTVGNNERGVEAYTELSNKLTVLLLIAAQLFHKSSRPRFCNRAKILNDVFTRHANPIVTNGQRLSLFINLDTHLVTLATHIKTAVFDGLKPAFINSV